MSDRKLTNEQIEAAVAWWCKVLRNPKYDNLGPTRGQDPEETRVNEMSSLLAMMLPKSDSSVIDKFGNELRNKFQRDAAPYCIGVDYGPDGFLGEAAKKSGMKTEFPWKTIMWFENGGVQVRYGYGAKEEEILKK